MMPPMTCDRILPLFGREPGRDRGRADFDAFAAARAGIGHGIGARLQGGFECLGHRHLAHDAGSVSANSGPD